MTQTRIDDTVEADYRLRGPPPKQNNYELIKDEIYILRKAVEESNDTMETSLNGVATCLYDLTVLIGLLQEAINIWVGVAEE